MTTDVFATHRKYIYLLDKRWSTGRFPDYLDNYVDKNVLIQNHITPAHVLRELGMMYLKIDDLVQDAPPLSNHLKGINIIRQSVKEHCNRMGEGCIRMTMREISRKFDVPNSPAWMESLFLKERIKAKRSGEEGFGGVSQGIDWCFHKLWEVFVASKEIAMMIDFNHQTIERFCSVKESILKTETAAGIFQPIFPEDIEMLKKVDTLLILQKSNPVAPHDLLCMVKEVAAWSIDVCVYNLRTRTENLNYSQPTDEYIERLDRWRMARGGEFANTLHAKELEFIPLEEMAKGGE